MPMPNPASGPAREAGPRDELAGILRDCADRVPGSLERLLACYDEHLRAHVGSTLARATVAGPALRAALTTAWAEAADFDPAREPAEAWLAARVRRARVAAGLIPFPARTDGRADGEPSDREAVPASPATAPRPRELHLRMLGPQGDGGVAEPPRPAALVGAEVTASPGLPPPTGRSGTGPPPLGTATPGGRTRAPAAPLRPNPSPRRPRSPRRSTIAGWRTTSEPRSGPSRRGLRISSDGSGCARRRSSAPWRWPASARPGAPTWPWGRS